jgi:uncharacterized protein
MAIGKIDLTSPERRVLGCLLEKQRTTPDVYPLSLNSLRLASNQSTNRDPVVDYDEPTILDALHRLERRGLIRLASGAGSRARKYRHLLADTLPMDRGEQAIMCVLMLRGAQTPGELKQRAERMHAFEDLASVQETLQRLIARELVARLDRRPGHKEERYADLLQDGAQERLDERAWADDGAPGSVDGGAPGSVDGGEPVSVDGAAPASLDGDAPHAGPSPALDGLHERVARLESEVAELRAAIGDPYERRQ